IGISENDIANDEPFSIFYAQMDVRSIFKMLATENNPALHFVLLHYWIKIFGLGAFSVRFISLLFSSLTVVVIFLTGKKFFSAYTGLFSSLIYTASYFHIYFSHEARVYPIFVFFTSLSLFLFMSIIDKPEKKKNYIWLFITNALLIYSHYFGFFVIVTEIFCVFIIPQSRKILIRFAFVILALLITYIPNIIIFINRISVSIMHGTWLKKPEWSELYGNINRFLNSKFTTIALIIMIVLIVALQIKEGRFKSSFLSFIKNIYSKIVFIFFVCPYLLMFCLSFYAPMFLDRYILYTSISLYLLISIIFFQWTDKKLLRYLSLVIVIIVMLYNFTLYPDNNRNVKELVFTVQTLKKQNPEMPLIISPDYYFREFSYSYNLDFFKDYRNTISYLNRENIFPANTIDKIPKEKLESKKIAFLDCATVFAFGSNPILDELKTKTKLDTLIHIHQIYDIYCFSTNN
ncbi:MAG: glycosyltransferase family 39 protein, partial [Bacteroidales bacterium]|nr:glycosyltransferase family 39 protein [Bacteroidales bacterium]